MPQVDRQEAGWSELSLKRNALEAIAMDGFDFVFMWLNRAVLILGICLAAWIAAYIWNDPNFQSEE